MLSDIINSIRGDIPNPYPNGGMCFASEIDTLSPAEGSIIFNITGEGVPELELRSNGDIYIGGRLADNDMQVVDAMREMLGLSHRIYDKGKY